MKYKLTNKTRVINGITLHQIQALTNFSDVKAGDLGGWIEREENLSQEGNCWVYDDARVYDNVVSLGFYTKDHLGEKRNMITSQQAGILGSVFNYRKNKKKVNKRILEKQ